MRKKINRMLVALLLAFFAIYAVFAEIAQLFGQQEAAEKQAGLIAGYLSRMAAYAGAGANTDREVWDGLLSVADPGDGSILLVADGADGMVLGASDARFEGKALDEAGFRKQNYNRSGSGFHVKFEGETYFATFFKHEGLLYGRLAEWDSIYRAVNPMWILSLAVTAAMLALLGMGIERYLRANMINPLLQNGGAAERLADGDIDAPFTSGKSEFSEVQQLTGLLNRMRETMRGLQMQLDENRHLLVMEAERADMANAAKKVFLSRMSHDVRTPMNGIIGMTMIAEQHIDDKERVLDALGKIDAASKQLLGMMEDILDMSMLESGRTELKEEDFQLADLINDVIEQMRPSAQARGHGLTLEVKNLVHEHVVGAPERVRTIFVNIIGNAIKYTPKGGEIRVSVQELPSEIRHAGKYCFVFEDNGVGMSRDTVTHLFEPFQGVPDGRRDEEARGVGLGLPIVKNIVQMMNGTIEVQSEEGEGSRFTVTISLKLQKRAEGVATRIPGSEIRLDEFRKENYTDKRVLVVEDNELNSEVAAEILAQTGIEVERVYDGQQAVLRIAEVPEGYFDMVMMDIQMPVMDGYIATRMIRNMERDDVKHMPIIAMTALTQGEEAEEARRSGMDEYLTKPIELDRLKEVLMKWL